MKPIISNEDLRRVERITMHTQGIGALELMERAGHGCAERILDLEKDGRLGHEPSYVVLTGMGNNGGDGLVVARHLLQAGKHVRVVLVMHRSTPSPEQEAQLEGLTKMGIDPLVVKDLIGGVEFLENEVVIDAILGSGADRPLEGWLRDLVAKVNASDNRVIAIDLPTGMPDVGALLVEHACIQAQHTLTFELPRLNFLFPEAGECLGAWQLVPIGLDKAALGLVDQVGNWVEAKDVSELLRPRPRFGHKGTFGHGLIVAGWEGFHGAGVLSAQGCARSGVGLFTVHAPLATIQALNTALPDAMTSVASADFSGLPDLARFSALGIGPGIGTGHGAVQLVEEVLTHWTGPMVVDADALTILFSRPDLAARIPPKAILTPHPKEMDRLLGQPSPSGYDRLLLTKAFASQHNCHVVLKGAYTAICTPDGRVFFNSTGNVGMAKGGSGDVLTGLLTGLLAQGYGPLEASLIGTHLHGAAGDLAGTSLGMDAMRPSDLVAFLPAAWQMLRS